MKILCLWFLALFTLGLPGALAAPATETTLLRWHYLGTDAISKDPSGTVAKQIFALPETAQLLHTALDHLARLPARVWAPTLPANATNQTPLLRPLLQDLLTAESRAQLRGPTNQWEWALVLRLPKDHAQRWNTNLWQLLSQWKLGSPTPKTSPNASGWELQKPGGAFRFQCFQTRDGIVLGAGLVPLQLVADYLKLAPGEPLAPDPASWVELELDWPALARWSSWFQRWPLPHLNAQWKGEGEYLKTTARLSLQRPLPAAPEAWAIPTNLIFGPLSSFMAARSIRPLLEHSKLIRRLGLDPLPNQVCLWGQPMFHGQTLLTAPFPNPTNSLNQIAPTLPKVMETIFGKTFGKIMWMSNKVEMAWSGLPDMTPSLRPASTDHTPLLLGGIIPSLGKTNPAPPGLFAKLEGRDNLLSYQWEITQDRILHHRHYLQLGLIVSDKRAITTNDLCFRWLEAIHPRLGNTVTEITQSAPAQLALIRRSHLGLTGVELVWLARWIDSLDFPRTLTLAPSPFLGTNRPSLRGGTNRPPPRAAPSPAPR